MGGTATVANILAKSFISRGHFCALGYMENSEHPSIFFSHKIKLVNGNRRNAEIFFQEHQFDIILDQLANITDFTFLLSLPLGNCKIISAYHSRPMFHYSMLETLLRIYSDSNNWLYKLYTLAKIPLIPLFRIKSRRKEEKVFKNINNSSDKILLLSGNFFRNWTGLISGTDSSKLVAIGNPLVFDNSLPIEDIELKEKLVIVIYSNPAKRAHLLLQIWKRIEVDARFNSWRFEFIGEGEGYSQILKLAKRNNLKRITFTGYQNTLPYYKRASIMMMTSKYEGWPMVLMEGQQMGVVPISYNSYESITDIITDGENGIIIPNNDMDCFVVKLKELMLNESKRKQMAIKAIHSSERFTLEKVTEKYLNLFTHLINEKKKIDFD
ncbi:MAG: glycosyltransferase [Prolixibacteraceae bacterium]